ncbi:MAG: CDP-alcohol phosphatidyltransferase family protein, partial [Thermoplasmata archaeon]
MTDRWRVAANLATLANALLGVGAILYVLAGNPLWAMLLVASAIAFDGLDGILSRRSPDPPTSFGRFADSVADGVTFGLAPAFLIAVHTSNRGIWAPWEGAALLLAGAYFAAAIARLVYFTARGFQRPYFLGVPTPEAALALIVALLFHDVPAFQSVQPVAVLIGVAVLSILM